MYLSVADPSNRTQQQPLIFMRGVNDYVKNTDTRRQIYYLNYIKQQIILAALYNLIINTLQLRSTKY